MRSYASYAACRFLIGGRKGGAEKTAAAVPVFFYGFSAGLGTAYLAGIDADQRNSLHMACSAVDRFMHWRQNCIAD